MDKELVKYIIHRILAGESDIEKIKAEASHKYGSSSIIRNTEIISNFPKSKLTRELFLLLKRKPMRTLSGVTPIAVMIKPQGSCRWGCIYCPFTGKAAKSYTGEEPAALRARDNDFDPSKQVLSRIKQFEINFHPTDKCEVIVMGGTFLAMDKKYKHYFIKSIYDSLNSKNSKNIIAAKRLNEKSRHRMVGLTIETRPDVCKKSEIEEMLEFGTTRVELGVQHPSNLSYKLTKRGHTVKDVSDSTELLKNSCFKILYHIMPGLPGSNPKKDVRMVKKLFEDQRFKPDMLKIYPTLVMPNTPLYDLTKKGEFEPYDSETASEVISEFYRYIPKYVRVMRIQRDIPATKIHKGVKKSNLREIVEAKIKQKRFPIKEIRFREIGLNLAKLDSTFGLQTFAYSASKGKEFFLSYENSKFIAGFLRLRIPGGKIINPLIDHQTALIRELHVYGAEAQLSSSGMVQHKGIGSKLLLEAERIAKEDFGMKKATIISGSGVRPYYYKKGYSLTEPYVSKSL
ncbi:tRNA uridine(34) 5-carboxymethylaminomethyl modification radical SAM/GNAT enzyme Elp3 [Candidatus Micrarchaeota archaeon]|nr:tRNA uridine(34) 5-carboxymethylaminomethyl modification radical SAM/GNAT enzyme Elp3 [Candidatus Micrarchaeota archaeon]